MVVDCMLKVNDKRIKKIQKNIGEEEELLFVLHGE
jgi:hypothetical protein